MTQGLTLYDLDQRLYGWLRKRQDLVDTLIVDPAEAAIRDAEVRGLDRVIDKHLGSIAERVDATAYVWQQLNEDAERLKKESKRLAGRAATLQADADRIRNRAAEVMRGRVEEQTPMAVMEATPGSYIETWGGKLKKLHLVKNPDGVDEPIGMSLLPEKMQNVTITLPLTTWGQILHDSGYPAEFLPSPEIGPDKRAILAELEKRVTCPTCKGSGITIREVLHADESPRCETCGGKGDVPNSVPGARLKHGVHVRIT
jgi:hypothetical protein